MLKGMINLKVEFVDLTRMHNEIREEINDAIKHIDYKKWLNVSFTGNKKWAI